MDAVESIKEVKVLIEQNIDFNKKILERVPFELTYIDLVDVIKVNKQYSELIQKILKGV